MSKKNLCIPCVLCETKKHVFCVTKKIETNPQLIAVFYVVLRL